MREGGDKIQEEIKEVGGGGSSKRVCRDVCVDVCWQGTRTRGEAGACLQGQDTCRRMNEYVFLGVEGCGKTNTELTAPKCPSTAVWTLEAAGVGVGAAAVISSEQFWGDSEDIKAGRGWRACFRCVGDGRRALAVLSCQVDAPCVCERQQEPERGGGRV